MNETISFCGIECTVCPAYVATQADDREALAKVAVGWSSQFGIDVEVESLLCDGCRSGARLCGYCGMCGVHKCASGRGVVTCAHCDDYGCEVLEACPAFQSNGREMLEKIGSEL
jgi:hypothetical protein